MLVWTVVVFTQFGSTVKEDRKVENTRRKISLPGHWESLALECRVPPKLATCRVSSCLGAWMMWVRSGGGGCL